MTDDIKDEFLKQSPEPKKGGLSKAEALLCTAAAGGIAYVVHETMEDHGDTLLQASAEIAGTAVVAVGAMKLTEKGVQPLMNKIADADFNRITNNQGLSLAEQEEFKKSLDSFANTASKMTGFLAFAAALNYASEAIKDISHDIRDNKDVTPATAEALPSETPILYTDVPFPTEEEVNLSTLDL